MAILSLVLGIVGLVLSIIPIIGLFAFLFAIPSIILGIMALVKAIKNHTAGKGLAIAGLICSGVALSFGLVIQAIAIPNFMRYRQDSRITHTRVLIANVETALNMYNMKYGRYPDSLEDLTKETDDMEALLQGDYIDSWGTEIKYEKRSGYRRRPLLTSAGPDGEFDTDDDISNTESKRY